MLRDLPRRELISCLLKTVPRLITRIDFRVHYVRIRERYRDQVVHMCWKASETRLIAHEAMDVHEQYTTSARVLHVGIGDQRLRR